MADDSVLLLMVGDNSLVRAVLAVIVAAMVLVFFLGLDFVRVSTTMSPCRLLVSTALFKFYIRNIHVGLYQSREMQQCSVETDRRREGAGFFHVGKRTICTEPTKVRQPTTTTMSIGQEKEGQDSTSTYILNQGGKPLKDTLLLILLIHSNEYTIEKWRLLIWDRVPKWKRYVDFFCTI